MNELLFVLLLFVGLAAVDKLIWLVIDWLEGRP